MIPRLTLVTVLAATLLVTSLSTSRAAEPNPPVLVLTIKGPITPVVAQYVGRVLGHLKQEEGSAVLIRLDTPGGLDSAMRDIIQDILNAPVPVIVYVAPAGARAASAGTFITMAAHVAAMAPNTAIGAAHPVAGGGEELERAMADKVTNDAAAYIRSLAAQRGRNAAWAEQAVRESVSVNAQEAVELGVVDLVAPDQAALLRLLEGRVVTLLDETVTLHLRDAPMKAAGMNAFERFLAAITEPNIAYLLLSLAMLALWVELSNPGAILPGVVGVIALLLALFALGNLPFNYTGLLLIGFAFLLFLLEVWVTSHGILAIGGIISLTLGSVMLMGGNPSYFTLSPWVMGIVVLAVAGFFIFVAGTVIQSRRRPIATGRESLVGLLGTARTLIDPEGLVHVGGELWTARTVEPPIPPGSQVRVTQVEGLRLWVRLAEQAVALGEPGRLPGPRAGGALPEGGAEPEAPSNAQPS